MEGMRKFQEVNVVYTITGELGSVKKLLAKKKLQVLEMQRRS